MWHLLLFALVAYLDLTAAGRSATQPHIVYMLTDNLGYGGVGFLRRDTPGGDTNEIVTPNLDSLADSGVILASFYTYKVCLGTPTTWCRPLNLSCASFAVRQGAHSCPVVIQCT